MKFNELIKATGKLEVWKRWPAGSELVRSAENIVVNDGLALMLDHIGGTTGSVAYFAWGSGGVSAGSVVPKVPTTSGLTTLDGSQATSSYSRSSNSATWTGILSISQGNSPGTISEFMLGKSGTTITALAAVAFQTVSKDSTFELQFEHTITLTNV